MSNTTNSSKSKSKKTIRRKINIISKKRTELTDCIKEDHFKDRINKTRKMYIKYRKLCSEQIYENIQHHFRKDQSIKNLLKFTYNYYKQQKQSEGETRYMLYLRDYINMFPRDDNIHGFRKQHVFECICKVLLLFNYDNNEFGNFKTFYKALEKYKKNPNSPTPLNNNDIIDEKINDGSAGQSVDIMFKVTPSKTDYKENTQPSCINFKETKPEDKNEKFILVQNKYFTEEKSSADKYDVTKISTRAKEKINELGDRPYEIVLMINNKQNLEERIVRNRNDDFKMVDRIFGIAEMDDWFQNMLYDMLSSKNFDEWLESKMDKKKTGKQSLSLRFHQKIIVESSNEYIANDYRKLIWGAVPRSGKSYMIAGLVEKRKHLNNDVVIILGAKTETLEQFKNMFEGLTDFDDYGIIAPITKTGSAEIKKQKEQQKDKKKFIYIYSQELIKISFSKKKSKDVEDELTKDNVDKFLEKFNNTGKNIDLYFDEIHKGGSTEKAEKDIITAINKYVGKIDIFVMVTATYAKPTIAYSAIIQDKSPITINWSYEDQQIMKEISNPNKLDEMLTNRETNISGVNDKELVENILLEYEKRYGDNYLNELEDEYRKHPELVIINPTIDDKTIPISANTFLLNKSCDAISGDLETLRDPEKIFENNIMVKNLLNSIGGYEQGNELRQDSIYGRLKYQYKYDWGKPHTELWFLPDKELYGENASYCRDLHKSKGLKTTGEEKQEYEDENEEESKKETLPNIEPLSRGIVLNLLNDDFFRENYCFVIVHGQKINYYSNNNTKNVFDGKCVTLSVENNSDKEIKKFIHDKEIEAFQNNKKLIILTGSKLRLGVSLPCVDIAFNFDNTQSVDLNYQTMFRVLTERPGKDYGYYIDFNKERSINFMYQFNEIYSSGLKKSKNIDQLTENLQALLYLFNYNGLNLIKSSPVESIKLYDNLIKELNLDSKSYEKRYLNKNTDFLKKIIVLGGDNYNDVLKSFKSYAIKGDNDVNNIKKELKKQEKKKTTYYQENKEEEKGEELSEPEDEEDEHDVDNIKDIVELFITFTAIIALFSNEIDCDELVNDKSSGCVDILIYSLDDAEKRGEIEKLYCDCEDYLTTLGCYIQRTEGWTPKKYKKALQIFKKFLEDNNPNHEQLINSIKIIYASIKDNMGKNKNALIYDMDTINIQDKIEQYLPVRKIEKELYGEVFTPQSLIEEILKKLPPKVWSNPDLKWLDPANGIGNFPMIAFKMLDEGLSKVAGYENKTKRHNHIIKNMLYMVELNEKNVAVSRKIFGKDANILCMSFLSEDYKDVNPEVIKKFGVEKFDVIMGNPPWNDMKVGLQSGSRAKNSLWDKFIKVSFTILKDNGYLTFINPSQWRGLGPEYHKIWNLLTERDIMYLHIYSKKEGKLFFNVGSRFDLYLVQNTNNKGSSIVIDEYGVEHNINFKTKSFLPNYAYNEIGNILTSQDKGIDVIMSYSAYFAYKKNNQMSQTKKGKYIYPVVHSITKEGITYWYSNDNTKGHFGVPKVILNFNEHQYSHKEQNDYKGEYGMSQISFGIPIKSKKEGDEILKAIDSDAFKKIIAATKWGAFQTDYRMFKYFKKDFYKHPMFTNKARTYSKPKSKSKSPGNKTKKFNTAGKVINKKTIKKPKNKKKKKHTIKRKFWF
tara:strand:+ start:1896 stop:6839 length:4944 start_codon:yes stop_codon:yes gene_type:complete